MTEVPEYLLERSRARRAAIQGGDEGDSGGGGDSGDSGAAAPATSEAAAPAAASMPAHPEPVEEPPPPPPSPMVQAHERRRKIPIWAMPVVAMIPIWAYIYVGTLSPPPGGAGPAEVGAEIYGAQCAGCHGGGGGGGTGPAFTDGAIYETWPAFEDHVEWVRLGSEGWQQEHGGTYGATDNPVSGGMPGFTEDQLSDAELVYVVLHERELGGENPDGEDAARLQAVADLMLEDEALTLDEAIETVESEGLAEAAAE